MLTGHAVWPNTDDRRGDHSKVDAFGLFTGQVGYAVNSALFCVKGAAVVSTAWSGAFS
jgi:outer membrane immunogenic protein